MLDATTWYSFEHNADGVNEYTEMHACFNDECCMSPNASNPRVRCDASKGYSGPLCGACGPRSTGPTSTAAVRSGRVCTACWTQGENIVATVALASVVVGTAVFVSLRSTNRRVGEYGGVLRRIAFSYMQMLGVLGIFKAKGTATFNEFVNRPAEIVGGSFTSVLPIKCTLGSQAYGER